MNIFGWLWVSWIAFFIIVEAIAVFNGIRGDTLSEFVWVWIGTGEQDRTFLQWLFRVGLAAFILWLIPHFMTGWRWFTRKK